jgi:hypothetical protein
MPPCSCLSCLSLLFHQVPCRPNHIGVAWSGLCHTMVQTLQPLIRGGEHEWNIFFVHLCDLHQLLPIFAQFHQQDPRNVGLNVQLRWSPPSYAFCHWSCSIARIQHPTLRPASKQLLWPIGTNSIFSKTQKHPCILDFVSQKTTHLSIHGRGVVSVTYLCMVSWLDRRRPSHTSRASP